MSIKKTVKSNLRALRQQAGLSQQKLAERTERSLSYISYLENNDSDVTISTLERFAEALGVPVAAIITPPDPALDKPPRETRAGLEYAARLINAKLATFDSHEPAPKRRGPRPKKKIS